MGKQTLDSSFTPQSPWLDLVNSQHWDGFGEMTDHLLDPGWVSRFLKYWNVPARKLGGTAPGRELAELRNLLRQATEKIAAGGSLKRRELRALNAFLNAPGFLRLISQGGQIRTQQEPVRLNWGWIRSQVVASFVDSLQGRPGRIKVCRNPECRWAFWDRTKGNIRRWCKDRSCGNRDRVRRARARGRKS